MWDSGFRFSLFIVTLFDFLLRLNRSPIAKTLQYALTRRFVCLQSGCNSERYGYTVLKILLLVLVHVLL